MNGCDDGTYAVTLTIAHTYEVTAKDEEEALREALKKRMNGEPSKVVWPAGYDIKAIPPKQIKAVKEEGISTWQS